MAKYITRQRKILLGFLSTHHDESLSARQIAEALKDEEISVSAVYRNLSELEADGSVRRVSSGAGRETVYQYADAEECRNSLHLSCIKCGRTFHMAVPDAAMLEDRLSKNEDFAIDKASTILYGTCGKCRR